MSNERVRLFDSPKDVEKSSVVRPRSIYRPRRKRDAFGPYSRAIDRGAIGTISGRSREGRYLLAYERMLNEHIGKRPTIVERAIITRAARVALHLELLDEQVFSEGKALNQHAYQHYCAWSNCLARLLHKLGMQPGTATDKPVNLKDYLNDSDDEAA